MHWNGERHGSANKWTNRFLLILVMIPNLTYSMKDCLVGKCDMNRCQKQTWQTRCGNCEPISCRARRKKKKDSACVRETLVVLVTCEL